MASYPNKLYKSVCPRSCPSSCSMLTSVKNNKITHINPDKNNFFTQGKLCAKGFSYIEQNYHPTRLKYPYYQEIKGSGKFKKISWDEAYELIISQLEQIYRKYNNFYPFALYKGTGNIGIQHNIVTEFFSYLNESTIIKNSASNFNNSINLYNLSVLEPNSIANSELVIIWGANPSASNIHLIPSIIDAKIKGANIVVIDPIYNQTASFANLFIQLKPNSDISLLLALIKTIEGNMPSLDNYSVDSFNSEINDFLHSCDISSDKYEKLIEYFHNSEKVSLIFGTGVLKHRNKEGNLLSIKKLIYILEKRYPTLRVLFHKANKESIFNNERTILDNNLRIIEPSSISFINGFKKYEPVEMVWISCGNPLLQEVNTLSFKQFIETVPFVVTVERFLTKSALMSNLILPTTSHFEEHDIIVNEWYGQLLYNEKIVKPYYNSKSDWTIMNELSAILNNEPWFTTPIPTFKSELDYLEHQFNERVMELYGVSSISDLKKKTHAVKLRNFTERYSDIRLDNDEKSYYKVANYDEDVDSAFPFWLITPNHPYMLNSQFHYLNLSTEKEMVLFINPNVGKQLNIFNGEIVTVYNMQSKFNVKANFNDYLPEHILLIYQGWYEQADVVINNLINSSIEVDKNNLASFFNSLVNIKKL